MRIAKKYFRTMRYGDIYAIQERIGETGDWSTVCECSTINEAKDILKTLHTLEGEDHAD